MGENYRCPPQFPPGDIDDLIYGKEDGRPSDR